MNILARYWKSNKTEDWNANAEAVQLQHVREPLADGRMVGWPGGWVGESESAFEVFSSNFAKGGAKRNATQIDTLFGTIGS